MGIVGPFGSRGEAKPERGDRADGRPAEGRAGQVMALIENDQPELVAQPIHVHVG